MRRNPLSLLTLISVLLHGYVAWRLLPALHAGALATSLLSIWLLASCVLVPAPLLLQLSRLSQRRGDALAWVGYLAMGVFSSLFVLTLLRDLMLAALALWSLLQPGTLDWPLLLQQSARGVLLLVAGISLIGLINARRTARVVDVDLPIAGLAPALQGFRIVQLSDIHVGPTIKRGYIDGIVRRVNLLDADMVAITGDVIDGSVASLREHVAPLAQLQSRYGTYCVTGNHEYYHGVEAWLPEWRRLGMRVLLNENEIVEHRGARLLIGGVTDFGGGHFDPAHASDAVAAARTATPVALKILLAHQPRSAPAAAEAGFDVQLSGHTHGGQFLPWNFFVTMQQPFVAGLNRLKQLLIYTSRGTGYWGPPLRFFAPSEITRLRLVAAN
jgi:predicted MPP superfamily phosphohydrolase